MREVNYEEYDKKIIDKAIKAFECHDVNFRIGLSCVDVLDFRKPGTVCYSLRVVFDHERGNRVYISGDLGEAVIYPTCPATLQGMAECFTRRDEDGTIHVNWGYFLEKVRAASDRYCWDSDTFTQDFKEHCSQYGISSAEDFLDEHMNVWDNGVDVDDLRGITLSEDAKRELEELDADYWEWVYDCGKRVSPRVILWLVALRLAYEAVESEVAK